MHVYACVCHMCIIIVCMHFTCVCTWVHVHAYSWVSMYCVCVRARRCVRVCMGVLLCTNYSVQDHFTCNIKSIANSLCLASVI